MVVYIMVARKQERELQGSGKMDLQEYTPSDLLLPKWPHLYLPTHLSNDVISPILKGLIHSLGQSLQDDVISGKATTNTQRHDLSQIFLNPIRLIIKIKPSSEVALQIQDFLPPKRGCNLSLNHNAGNFQLGEKCVLQIFTLLI